MPVDIVVNGEPQTVPEGETILGLLRRLQLDPERVAVELDQRIVRQPKWSETALADGSRVEIVQFVGGG
jgi:sulfur carrier protein